MKIGILTFHRAKNYGAMLQAYALQETLRMKWDTYIIDYRNTCIEKSYYINKQGIVKFVKRILKSILLRPETVKHNRKDLRFNNFQKSYYILSKKYNAQNIIKSNKCFDVFISGSDQIWNLKWSNYDWNYFLNFSENKKKYSYAASISQFIPEEDRTRIKDLLKSYQAVVVREKESVRNLRETGIYQSAVDACDPVFLLDRSVWINRFSLKKNKNSRYLLVYIISKETYAIEVARKEAQKKGLSLVYLNLVGIPFVPEGFENVTDAGPIEFLNYILNAEMVITTSFHGLAFSIIMHTPVLFELCKETGNVNTRLQTVAENLGVTGCEIKGPEWEEKEINWEEVDKRLNKYVEKSKCILFSTMSMAEEKIINEQ